eukprot:scaffold530_cov193-Alexandrium_tamarense.AAC.37
MSKDLCQNNETRSKAKSDGRGRRVRWICILKWTQKYLGIGIIPGVLEVERSRISPWWLDEDGVVSRLISLLSIQ